MLVVAEGTWAGVEIAIGTQSHRYTEGETAVRLGGLTALTTMVFDIPCP
jgi:hypothetical protein